MPQHIPLTFKQRTELRKQGKKYCAKCRTIKEWGEFYANAYKPFNVTTYCKACHDRKNGKHRKYYLKCAYGITEAEYNAMVQKQDGKCAICKQAESEDDPSNPGHPKKLAVDHDHNTDEIRELLCKRCNTLLGYAKDSVAICFSAAAYLMKWKKHACAA